MNDKKSLFGDLCHMHRVRLHLSEAEMGQKIEELGYKLGSKPGSSRQPVISQFERAIDPPGATRKHHRDPPLDYVETCARLFKLNPAQRYDLFVAALKSSEKVIIDEVIINDKIKETILCLLAALLMSGKEFSSLFTYNRYALNTADKDFLNAWEALKSASDRLIKELKERNDSKH
jgi:hypothetical protein